VIRHNTCCNVICALSTSGPVRFGIEISENAKELGIPEKDCNKTSDRMTKGRLEFSLQCDPASMIWYVQFAILKNVEKFHDRDVYERMYSEFQENILYNPSIIDPNDLLIFILFAENVLTIDFVLAKVDIFEGVKKADVYILTKLEYYNDWIITEIDETLLPERPLSHKSIMATSLV
jgi:hypothetical protein